MHGISLENIKRDKKLIEKFGISSKEEFNLLGFGEYNINYTFNSNVYNKKLILRIATDSQMNISNQIEYEYKSLELLNKTGRVPQPIFYDNTRELLPYGFLVMEYLPGRHLNYRTDLKIAGELLAYIHNEPVLKPNHLQRPSNPINTIYEECQMMFAKYKISKFAEKSVKNSIEFLLEKGRNILPFDIGSRTIINTELNSGNFLINERAEDSYVIDWEKPIYAYPAQDLGHFLAPTTTFWKTDIILEKKEINDFIKAYCSNSNQYKDKKELWKSVKTYLAMNCLRGITWCSMAYIEYQNPDKVITNNHTYEKIKAYMSEDFLDMIKEEYLNEY